MSKHIVKVAMHCYFGRLGIAVTIEFPFDLVRLNLSPDATDDQVAAAIMADEGFEESLASSNIELESIEVKRPARKR